MIHVDEEFKALIPPLSREEYKQLEENCVKEGIRDPLVVWKLPGNEILIDGHNRWEISAKHAGIRFNVVYREFENREAVKEWIIKNQLGRRNIPPYVRAELALKLKPVIAEKAKERMLNAPQKKVEREKEIKEIYKNFPYETAVNLAADKRKQFADEDRRARQRAEKYIYFARYDKNRLKIGSSTNPQERIKQLSVSCPGIELIEAILYGEGAEKHENAIKKKFAQYQIGNECYQCQDEILKQMIAYTKKEAARKGETDYQLAKVAGVSHDTIHKVEVIKEKANELDPRTIEDLRRGDVSINKVYSDIKASEHESIRQQEARELREAKKRAENFENSKVVAIGEAKQNKDDNEKLFAAFKHDFENMIDEVRRFSGMATDGRLEKEVKRANKYELHKMADHASELYRAALKIQRVIAEVIDEE